MKLIKEKSGEFYIVAAIIIAAIIISLTGVVTYTVIKNQPKNVEDLSSDLREETPRILDYGIYNGTNVTSLVENFTSQDFASYFSKKVGNTNVTFIYGDSIGGVKAVLYKKRNIGSTSLGGSSWDNEILEKVPIEVTIESPDPDGFTYVTILNKRHKFKLKRGDMFYFVLTDEKEGEHYVGR